MFELINNYQEIEEEEFLNEYIEYLVKKLSLEKSIFNIIFVDDKEIHEINLKYRNVDRETDVISFALEDGEGIINPELRVLGDIYLCIPVAYRQALEYGHSRKREVAFLVTHGILHLLGYDHIKKEEEKIMFEKQEELLNSYDIFR